MQCSPKVAKVPWGGCAEPNLEGLSLSLITVLLCSVLDKRIFLLKVEMWSSLLKYIEVKKASRFKRLSKEQSKAGAEKAEIRAAVCE